MEEKKGPEEEEQEEDYEIDIEMHILRKRKVQIEREEYINNVIFFVSLLTCRQSNMDPCHSPILLKYKGKGIHCSTFLLLVRRW